MINWGISWRNSIFFRLFVTFLLIMLPVFATAYSVYNLGVSSIRSDLSNSLASQVNFYTVKLETDIQRIKTLQYDFINDDDLNQLASVPDSMDLYGRTKAILTLQTKLIAIKNSSGSILDVCTFIPSIGKVISAVDGAGDLPRNEFEALWKTKPSAEAQIVYWQGRLFLDAVPSLRTRSDKQPLFIVSIELSANALSQMLSQMNESGGEGSFMFSPAGNFLLSSGQAADAAMLKNMGQGVWTERIGKKTYLVAVDVSKYLGFTFCRFTEETRVYNSLAKYRAWFWGFIAISVVIIVVYCLYTYRVVHRPLRRLVSSFRQAENGNLDISIRHERNDEFAYLYTKYNEMVKNLKTLIEQVYQQRIFAQRAELKQLQSQINPHFLFNSFFILHRRIEGGDYENALLFSEQLGDYFRFITRSAADEVPLSNEVEHARIYANIQCIRFSRRLQVEFADLPDEFQNLLVPRLILQPVIENAFEHGLEGKRAGGLLRISFGADRSRDESVLRITVEDNGDCLTDSELESIRACLVQQDAGVEITGIVNINRRVQLKFGGASGVSVSRSELGGLRVEIAMALRKGAPQDVQTSDRG